MQRLVAFLRIDAALLFGGDALKDMKTTLGKILRLIVLVLLVPWWLKAEEADAAGRWQGEFLLGKPRPVTVEIRNEAGVWSARYEGPDGVRRAFKQVELSGDRLRLTTAGGSAFDGAIKGEVFAGTYRHDATRQGTFTLRRSVAPVLASEFIGAYRTEDGELYTVGALQDSLVIGRSSDGWARVLAPQGEDAFTVGASLLGSQPIEGRVRFERDATGLKLLVSDSSGRTGVSGRHVPFSREEIHFANGGVMLSGTLYLPREQSGPRPAIVMLHGAGPALRDGEPWLHMLVAEGFAVLTFDKRGCGRSGGDTWRAAFETYAADAIAAIAALQARADIRRDCIGLYGPSQGGYVGLAAAARSDSVAFVVLRSTPAVAPFEQEEFRLMQLLTQRGYPPSEIAQAREFVRAKLRAPSSGDWAAYAAATEAARASKWFSEVGGAPERSHPAHEFWRLNGGFDPLAALAASRCPVLWLSAEFDEAGPTDRTSAALRDASARVTHAVIPRANHGMLRAVGFEQTEETLPRSTGLAPEFLHRLRAWLTAKFAVLGSETSAGVSATPPRHDADASARRD